MSNVKFAARVTNYTEAAKFLGDKWERKIGYKTVVRRSVTNPHMVSLIHHDTAIITWSDGDPVACLFTDGIVSRTTANRLNYFTPDRYRIGSHITDADEYYTITDTVAAQEVSQWTYNGYSVFTLWLGPSIRRPRLAGVNY